MRSILLTKSLDSFWPLRTHFSFELFPRSNVVEQRGEQETKETRKTSLFKDIFGSRVRGLLLGKVLCGLWDGGFWHLLLPENIEGLRGGGVWKGSNAAPISLRLCQGLRG